MGWTSERMKYKVELIPAKLAKEFVRTHHYSRGCHNGPAPCYGLYDNEELIGCLVFATPCSENVRKSLFGPEYKDNVKELHRLVILDVTPKNTESWFIAKVLKRLQIDRPDLWGIISFADKTQGHYGTIYQATNALYCGTSSKATFYLDKDDRLRHPRQNGVNISLDEAKKRGWKPVKRDAKFRYVYIVGNRKEKRDRKKLLLLDNYDYPKENKE